MTTIKPYGLSFEKKVFQQIFFIIACVIFYSYFRSSVWNGLLFKNITIGLSTVIAISLLGLRITYKYTPTSYKILLRSIFGIILFYVVTSHISIPGSILKNIGISTTQIRLIWFTAIIFGLIAFIRPCFGLVPIYYVTFQKLILSRIYNLPLTHIDYITLSDTGSYIIFGTLILYMIQGKQFSEKAIGLNLTTSNNLHFTKKLHPLEFLLLSGIALHFGNYYYAALYKMSLGDHPFFWLLENHTHFLILMGLENRVMPLSFSPTLTDFLYGQYSRYFILFNLATIIGQGFCIIAITRIRWAMAITVFYDITHIAIFLLTGIFFWKWILFNFSIVWALNQIRNKTILFPQKIVLVLMIAVSPRVFHIPKFAWLDTPAVNTVNFYANTQDGRKIRMPANYMLGISVTFQQQRLVWPKEGPFHTWTFGTTLSADEMRASMTCNNIPNSGEPPPATLLAKR